MTIIKIYVTIQLLPFSCIRAVYILCLLRLYMYLIVPGTEKGTFRIDGLGKIRLARKRSIFLRIFI